MCKNTNHHNERIVSKFSDFLTESQVIEILLEGNLMASSKFLDKLSTITTDPIANILFKSFSDKTLIEKDLPQNWVDVTDKDDAVSFMADRIAARSENNPDAIYSSASRSEVKVGRLARAILTELGHKFTDRDIELFVNNYKSAKVEADKNLKLVSGIAIKKYYLQSNYSESRGQLGGSCMRYDNCQKFFRIYTKNPEVCQLLVYVDDNDKVLGRALVWKISEKELYTTTTQEPFECKAEYFMDRVYTINDSDVNRFTSYAKRNGWLYKYKMNSGDISGMAFKYKEETIFGRIIIKLQRGIFTRYPYVDTLTFSNGYNMISNVGFVSEDSDDPDETFQMNDTDGRANTCNNCRGSGYEPDNGGRCRKCNGDGELDCPQCDGGGEKICGSCQGGGNVKCTHCNAQGSNQCTHCNGRGAIVCATCTGNRYTPCVTCQGAGDLGDCAKCEGAGDTKCTECGGLPLVCKICTGAKKITRKWGNGTRVVVCPGCGGLDGAITGTRKHLGCRCTTCSRQARIDGDGQGWRNMGKLTCTDCRGNGKITCTDCRGYGRKTCATCNGAGASNCTHCRYGRITCANCHGNGTTGTCPDCHGTGRLGKCDNCKDGVIVCDKCEGSGKRPEGAPRDLCNKCSGILDKLKSEISEKGFNRVV